MSADIVQTFQRGDAIATLSLRDWLAALVLQVELNSVTYQPIKVKL